MLAEMMWNPEQTAAQNQQKNKKRHQKLRRQMFAYIQQLKYCRTAAIGGGKLLHWRFLKMHNALTTD